MTDYNLNTSNGDKIIESIRSKNIFTEILFYSAKEANLKLSGLVDRISYFSTKSSPTYNHQDAIVEKLKELISLTVKKFQHIVSMRGMIMHETCTLDDLMLDIIARAFERPDIDFASMKDDIICKLEDFYKEKCKKIASCHSTNNFDKLVKDTFLFSAKYRILTIGKILQLMGDEDFTSKYESEVNSYRNKFAHVKLLTDSKTGRQYFKARDTEINFDEDLCRRLRKSINTYKRKFEELHLKL